MITPNPEQQRAIQAPHDRPVRIVAGAGTGKTEVISQRYVHLLSAGGLRPDQILVLTFSDKAAAEMRARIFRAVSSAGIGYRRLDLTSAAISTFHAFGSRLLRDHSLHAGVDLALPFLTETDAADIMNAAMAAFLEDGYTDAYDFDPLEKTVYTWENGGPVSVALALVGQLGNQAVAVERFVAAWQDREGISDRHAVMAPLVSRLYQTYRTALIRRGQLDFDRLIMGAVELLSGSPELSARIQRMYRAILVDEYQDTNYAQERLLRALAHDAMQNVTVVGDPRQAIYVWREARVANIAGFPGDGETRIEAPLARNWRSTQPILDVANLAIAGYEFDATPEFDATGVLESARPDNAQNHPAVTLRTFDSQDAEAEAVASYMTQFRREGRAYRDMAILIRARTYLDVYIDALGRSGIPFDVSAGDAFYTRPEVLQAIHLLRVIVDPLDSLALAVTLLSPVAGLSQPELARLAQMDVDCLWEAVIDPDPAEHGERVAAQLRRFRDFHEEAQRQRWQRSPAAFVGWVLHASGLASYITVRGLAVSGRALNKFLAISHTYETERPGDLLPDLVRHLRQLVLTEPRETTPELAGDADAVAVMTAHASKGLEFPVVFAVDNRQRLSPAQRKTPFHEPGAGLVFPEDDERHPAVLNRTRQIRNEARCLWYVTLTRAKERLVITAPDASNLQDDGLYSPVRTFFQELWNHEAARPSAGVERIA